MPSVNRRTFLRTTAVSAAGVAAAPAFARARAKDTIGVGVIGCGGRGTGAAWNALEADPAVKLVAYADLFQDRLDGCRQALNDSGFGEDRVAVPDGHCFVGFDAYERLLALDGIDYVILATPPGFRPAHFEAAVDAGRHVFMEKSVAVDPVGVRRVIAAGEAADAKELSVVTGTQRRHEASYLAAMAKVHAGDLGEIVSARCYWNQGGLWKHDRQPGYSDMEWQCRNWLYSCWLSGDHICEQHVHNLDVVNWALGALPTRAIGMGGRQVRTAPAYGNIFDHFTIEYEYPNDVTVLSMCRQIDGCAGRVQEVIVGTDAVLTTRSGYASITDRAGNERWRYDAENPNPYVEEHVNLIASIRGERKRINFARTTAESTLTAIMGRMSAYTGQNVNWKFASQSQLDLTPGSMVFGDMPLDPVPVPGRRPLI